MRLVADLFSFDVEEVELVLEAIASELVEEVFSLRGWQAVKSKLARQRVVRDMSFFIRIKFFLRKRFINLHFINIVYKSPYLVSEFNISNIKFSDNLLKMSENMV